MTIRVDRSRSRTARSRRGSRRCQMVRSYGVPVRMYDDPRRSLRPPGQIQGLGNLIEPNDRTDTRQGVEATRGDRLEDGIPILRVRAAAELNRDSLTRRIGDAETVAAVPAAGTEDARVELAIVHDLLHQPIRPHTLEHHCGAGQSALSPHFAKHVKDVALGGIYENMCAKARLGDSPSLCLVIGNDDRVGASVG